MLDVVLDVLDEFFTWQGLLVFAFAYLAGSIPFGLILTRLAGLGDIRVIGSGNIGATNVLRTGNKKLAAATLVLDALKGTAVVLIAAGWGAELALIAALGAFLGHLFPIWLCFKGGKGVATFLGCLIAVAWPVALAFAAIWIVVAWLSRYSSLAALAASAVTPVILFWAGNRSAAIVFLALAILLWCKHHQNIRRLIAGREGRIGAKD